MKLGWCLCIGTRCELYREPDLPSREEWGCLIGEGLEEVDRRVGIWSLRLLSLWEGDDSSRPPFREPWELSPEQW